MPSVLPFWSRAAERAKAQEDQVNQPPTPAPPNNNDRPNPESEAGWLSRLLFLWVDAVLRTGEEACRLRDCLEAEELFALHPSDEATWNFKSFQHAWGEQDQVCKAKGDGVGVSLRSVLYREFRASLWETGALKYINDVAQFVLPLVLLRLLRGLEDPSSPSLTLYGLAVLIFVLTAFRVSIENHYFYKTFRLGAQLGGAVSCKVYHKALALAPSARQTRSSGELVNYMQLDANKLMMFTQSVHVLWSGLHQILGYTAVLYSVISWSALVGVALLVILIPVQGMLQVGLMRYRGQANKETDARIKLTNEILQGIKTIKMYGWEESFAEAMGHIRSLELSQLRKLAMVSAVNTAIFMCTPAFATVITFVVYTAVQGQSFSAAQAFTAVTLFNSLRFPLIFYPAVLAQYAGVKLSLARLDAFFALEEIDPSYFTFAPSSQELQPLDSPSATGAGDGNDGPTSGHKANTAASLSPKSGRRKAQAPEAIQIKDGDFSRTFAPPSSGSPEGSSVSPALTLADVNLTVHKGELVAVVGRVSRGKTTLCASLLGELSKCKGSVMVKGSVAYVPQSPWVFNATLRDNIVFGHVFDEELYERVLSACALTADVKMLRHGDLTEIGERGINLSGGQKQRVAIARAVYSGADVIIMDDPLSALDAHVCKHVFDNCLRGPLLRGRTVLLATNQLQFVAHTDYVIVLANQDGDKGACHIAQQGTYRELMNTTQDGNSSTSGFKALMQDLGLKASSEQDTVDEEEAEPAQAPELPSASKRAPDVLPSMAVSPKPVALVGGKELTKTEAREKGSVPLTTYVTYVRAARSWLLVAVVLGCFAIANAVDKISQWWISYWTEDSSLTRHPLALYLVLFLLLNIAVAVLTSLRTVLFAILGQRSAKNMHTQLTASVLAAPLAWFDSTPTGRVVNRFSADLSTLDEALPTTMAMFLNMLLSLLATIATIAVLLPWVLLGLAPLSFYYASVLRYYNTTNRELKRLDSVSRSPIFSLFAETLQGLASIRAFKKEPFYSHRITSLLDSNRRAYMSMMALQRWLGLRIELIADALILVVSLACIAQRTSLAPALAALALSQATFTTGMLNFVIRMAADTEAQMNSVERVLEFSTKLPQELQTLTATLEPQPDVEQAMTVIVATNQQLPSSWPSEGSICFRDYKMRYREGLDLALKGISLRIEGGEKIGVCGRTGSGKSTVMLALLRLVEGAEGAIEVDGLDIKHVPLKTLRTKVSIIPQEAVLFSGTFRYNLDPFEAYTDDQIWTALDKVHLKATVSALPAKLETRVSEGGENFSLGQRQLVCLARALLRESHILLLDEATASVDYETDVLVQRTVRAEFKHCTVLTIAHRLNTIIDSDKVLVLDGGLVAEFGPPHELVQKDGQGAVFRSLVDETGPDYAATLKNQAQQAYEGYLQRQAQRPHSNDDAEHVSDNHQNHERRRSSCISLVDIPLE